jgi:hypothetical protein
MRTQKPEGAECTKVLFGIGRRVGKDNRRQHRHRHDEMEEEGLEPHLPEADARMDDMFALSQRITVP